MILRLVPPLLFLGSGWGVLASIGARRGRPLPIRMGWAYLAGTAWVGLALFVSSQLFRVPLRSPLVWVALLLPPGVAAIRHRPAPPAPRSFGRGRLLVLVPLVVTAPILAALLVDAIGRPLEDGDGRAIWAIHARFMRDEGTVAPATIRDPAWLVEHPRYPPLMPLVQVAALEALDLPNDDRGFRPVYAFFLPALVLVTYDLASHFAGALPGALAAALLPLLPQLTAPYGGAAGAYSDLPLAAFWGGGFLLLRCRRRDVPLAALLLAAAVATKNEGAPLALLLLGVALVPGRGTFRWRALWVPTAAVGAVFLLLFRFRAGIASRLDEDYASLVSARGVLAGLHHNLPVALPEMFRQLGDAAAWGSFWMLVLVAGIGGFGAFRRSPIRRVAATLAIAWGIPLAAYTVSARDAVLWLVAATTSRFALQTIVPASLLFAAFLRELLRPLRSARSKVVYSLAAVSMAVGFALFRSGSRFDLLPRPVSCPCAPPGMTGDDPTLPSSIDIPAEQETVHGELLVRGWSQEEAGPSDLLTVWIDDEVRHCLSSVRTPRPDVQAVLPKLGPTDHAGYEVRYPFRSGDDGPHRLRVRFWSPSGKVRTLERRFVWRR